MKNEKLAKALDQIDDKYLNEITAAPKPHRPYWIAAVAAVLALVITLSLIPWPQATPGDSNMDVGNNTTGHTTGSTHTPPTTNGNDYENMPLPPLVPDSIGGIDFSPLKDLRGLLSSPVMPDMVKYPIRDDFADYDAYRTAMDAWNQNQMAQYNQPEGYADSLTDFFRASIHQYLSPEKNSAYSPVNVYLAMAMLAETTDGNSRQQILDLFGLETIEELRTQADHVWNAHYCNDGRTTLLLANSLWLDTNFSFHRETVDRLSSLYAASVFSDHLYSEEANQQLRAWLNAMTGNMLQEQANNVKFPPDIVFALASTIFFKAGWVNEFPEDLTKDDVFHAASGDITATYMRNSMESTCYFGSNFSAIALPLHGNNRMWIILPNEGTTVEEVMASAEYLDLTLDPNRWQNVSYASIHVTLPKFDISSQADLIAGMKNMGVTDIFNPVIANFSPLTPTANLAVSEINHAARVAIDEKGIIAAAFTVIFGEIESCPSLTIDFTVDRPFLFVVSSQDNLPLFAGVVANP